MQDLSPALAATRGHVLAHLPIHRRLQAVLDRERAAFDEEIAIERGITGNAHESLDELRVLLRVDIGVRDLCFRRAEQFLLNFGVVEVGMIEPYRHRPEEAVEVDQLLPM